MYILIDGQVHNTGDKPILMLLTPEEKNNIRRMPDKNDLFCGYPSDWDVQRVHTFITENKQALVDTRRKQLTQSPAVRILKKLSDEALLDMLSKEKSDQ